MIITDRGKPAHVLLSIEEYERLTRPRRTLAEALHMPCVEDIQVEFDRPKVLSSLRIPDYNND